MNHFFKMSEGGIDTASTWFRSEDRRFWTVHFDCPFFGPRGKDFHAVTDDFGNLVQVTQ